MFLRVINSGSDGNCYILENDTEALILEAGCKISEVKKALNFNISKAVGCLVTHEHGDHAKYVSDLMKCGIDVYASDGTRSALKVINGELVNPVKRSIDIPLNSGESIPSYHPFQLGGFTVHPFATKHNCIEPVGFLIKHPDIGKLLFATDTELIYHDFTKVNLNHILIESNYAKELIKQDAINRDHVLTGHMEFSTCLDFLSKNDNQNLRNVVLLHLSNNNSDENLFQEKTNQILRYGTSVYIADKGLNIELSLPF